MLAAAQEAASMVHRNTTKHSRAKAKTILRLPDLEQSKTTVLHSLGTASSQESYRHAIDEFIGWYCSEPRLAFNRTVVLRCRFFLEQKNLAPSTINASSPRSQQIQAYLEQQGLRGVGAAQIAAHQTRDGKRHRAENSVNQTKSHSQVAMPHEFKDGGRYRIRTYDFHRVNESSIGKQRSYRECSVMLGNIESTN